MGQNNGIDARDTVRWHPSQSSLPKSFADVNYDVFGCGMANICIAICLRDDGYQQRWIVPFIWSLAMVR